MIELTLVGSSIPVALKNATGETESLELREMTAASRDQYIDVVGGRMLFDPKGVPIGLKKAEGLQAELLSRCLYRTHDEKPVLVSKGEIQGWPTTVVNRLFDEARRLNRINDDGEKVQDESKKD